MVMTQVAITEVIAEHRRRRNRLRDSLKLRPGARPRIAVEESPATGNFEDFDTDIPLDSQVLRRNLPGDFTRLTHHRGFISAVNQFAIGGPIKIRRTSGQRSRQTHLKAHRVRYLVPAAQFAKYLIGVNRPSRVAQVAEFERVNSRSHPEDPVVGIVSSEAVGGLRAANRFNCRMLIEDADSLTLDPTLAYTDLAVGESLEMITENRGAGLEHFFGGFARHAADKQDVRFGDYVADDYARQIR